MSTITPERLQSLYKPAPRYTSYPTAPAWDHLSPEIYANHLKEVESPLSLYFHIPFCKTMCLFCGCSVILNRKVENEERYVHFLMKEIDLVTQLTGKKEVLQLHFGGGTPTKLSQDLFAKLFEKIRSAFSIDFSGEIAIEIDPRTVFEDQGAKLRFLKAMGFNRVSFGVQDTNERVQEAIKRHQSREMTVQTFALAKAIGFQSINLDLIYGLPFQTLETFSKTIEEILQMRPDRIALFSYAKVPWLKAHQKAIPDETLPSIEEKFAIYAMARRRLVEAGYIGIGMDHFALEQDDLALSYHQKTLKRNFQGYTTSPSSDLIGFGVTSIGFVRNGYFQNQKELASYYASLEKGLLPTHRGKILSEEDLLRKWVIHTLMCSFILNKRTFEELFYRPFDQHFYPLQTQIKELIHQGLLEESDVALTATPLGELFIRNIVMIFDAYLMNQPQKYSTSI